ncbi:MAG TPA: CDP-glucose 4,6-dehydratase [Pyrinomonadaceae bacterium]|nr:CDP-glucose 4,6-dehydratase [Pyrinomonadaceae bacterium]
MRPEFWKDKRVFITGHTGFKGSWLSLWLQLLGAEVVGYSQPAPTEPSLFELARVAERMQSIEGDVGDFAHLDRALSAAQPEIVVHMAAQSLVRRSYLNPVETYATNVMGTVHLLEAARKSDSIRALLVVTSDKCYENREWVWGYRESDPMGGYDPYSSSKGCAELATAAFRNSFFNGKSAGGPGAAIASVRAGNVIGGGDWAEDRLLPDIMRRWLDGRSVLIRNPHAVRPWQHVLDPLGAYLLLAEKLYEEGARYAESWNFGPRDADARPVSWLVERCRLLWGGDTAVWERDQEEHPHEASYLKLDCSKARAVLGWEPRWDLERALEATVHWYRAYRSGEDARELTLKQIEDYQNDCVREVKG